MELATNLQGCGSTFSSVHSSFSRGRSKIKHSGWKLHEVGRFKCTSSLGSSLVLRPKPRSLQISAFKGSVRHGYSGGRAYGAKPLNNPLNIAYFQHERNQSLVESSNAKNVSPTSPPATDETTNRSLAIQNLFKYWLMLLRTQSQNRPEPLEEVVEESSSKGMPGTSSSVEKLEKVGIGKAMWRSFLSLDTTINLPLLIFTPLYLAVNLRYGSEVSKELTPFWIIGPLVMALYIKMFRAICGLYVFSFTQTVKIIKNMPAYCSLTFDYLFRGKLKEALNARLWQPLADIKNMDYKGAALRKLKDLRSWLVEKYLDFVESIWPYYCRTIRFLKRANLI